MQFICFEGGYEHTKPRSPESSPSISPHAKLMGKAFYLVPSSRKEGRNSGFTDAALVVACVLVLDGTELILSRSYSSTVFGFRERVKLITH